MALRVKVSARAASQIRRAADWWHRNRSAAPGAVAQDIGESVALLAEQPGIGAKYEGADVHKHASRACGRRSTQTTRASPSVKRYQAMTNCEAIRHRVC